MNTETAENKTAPGIAPEITALEFTESDYGKACRRIRRAATKDKSHAAVA